MFSFVPMFRAYLAFNFHYNKDWNALRQAMAQKTDDTWHLISTTIRIETIPLIAIGMFHIANLAFNFHYNKDWNYLYK